MCILILLFKKIRIEVRIPQNLKGEKKLEKGLVYFNDCIFVV